MKVVFRNCIKVHFQNQQAAMNENYSDYDRRLDMSKGSIIYPFTGIRGEAKDLWRLIKRRAQSVEAGFVQDEGPKNEHSILP